MAWVLVIRSSTISSFIVLWTLSSPVFHFELFKVTDCVMIKSNHQGGVGRAPPLNISGLIVSIFILLYLRTAINTGMNGVCNVVPDKPFENEEPVFVNLNFEVVNIYKR